MIQTLDFRHQTKKSFGLLSEGSIIIGNSKPEIRIIETMFRILKISISYLFRVSDLVFSISDFSKLCAY